jgi:hypothetical protein
MNPLLSIIKIVTYDVFTSESTLKILPEPHAPRLRVGVGVSVVHHERKEVLPLNNVGRSVNKILNILTSLIFSTLAKHQKNPLKYRYL